MSAASVPSDFLAKIGSLKALSGAVWLDRNGEIVGGSERNLWHGLRIHASPEGRTGSMNHERTPLISRRTWLGGAALVPASLALMSPGLAEAAEGGIDPFLRTFRFVGGDKERKALERAIDGVVSQMSVFARGIARSKLREGTAIPETMRFSANPKVLSVTMDKQTQTGPRDGRPVKVKVTNGDDMEMRFSIASRRITQSFAGDDKGRVNRFDLDGETEKLQVKVTISSSRLPQSLVYTLTYAPR